MDQSSPPSPDYPSSNQQLLLEFNDLVANILMSSEELRRSIKENPSTDDVLQWRDGLEHLLSLADPLARRTRDAVGSPIETDMFRHCHEKIQLSAKLILEAAFHLKEPDPDDPYLTAPIHSVRNDGQAAIARITEINLRLANSSTNDEHDKQTELVNSYVTYQRQVLRQRAKPAIARLVQARKEGVFQRLILDHPQHHHTDDAIDDDDDEQDGKATLQQFHAPALADILGQAAALIHPLLLWLLHLPPDESDRDDIQTLIAQLCIQSIQTLNTQAQELSQTVSNWFWEDRPMEEWMARTTSDETVLDQTQVSTLDGLVEEMAFACQVQARYHALFEDATAATTRALPFRLNVTALQDQLLPEFAWKYASLERYLALQQWQSAVALAIPVPIVMGTNIHVPSVVEDAQYLSTRALERAALTESRQAIGTVAHAISHDIWSIDVGGVSAALTEERGCWMGTTAQSPRAEDIPSPPRSGFESGFVSALMDALDEEEPSPQRPTPQHGSANSRTPRAPSSGNFLLNIVGASEQNQLKMDAEFCSLNGYHAASAASQSLAILLETLLPPIPDAEATIDTNVAEDKTLAMIRLAREELLSYSKSYQQILGSRILVCLDYWCGSVEDQGANWEGKLLPQVRVFFEVEDYLLNEDTFEAAERDERLNHELLLPLEECTFLRQLADKCDADVLSQLSEALVFALVKLILDVLWKNEKEFTDWGALLLSKQVRLLQKFCGTISCPSSPNAPVPNLLASWERLSQAVCVLQLEKPADWLAYSGILTPDEVLATMRLRTDFSMDAINAVTAQLDKA